MSEESNSLISIISDWLDVQASGGLLPESFTYITNSWRQFAASRDHIDVQRTFPLVTSTKFGDWFEKMPIDVTPRLPRTTASSELTARISLSLDDGDLAPEDFFHFLLEPNWFDSTSENDRCHSLWLAFISVISDQRPWTRDSLYLEKNSHHDPEVRALVVSIAYLDLPWPPAENFIYRATHDTDELVFLPAFRICGRRHDERAMDHLLTIVANPSAVLSALAQDRMQYPVGHAACSICPGQFAILGTDNPKIASKRENYLRSRVRQPLAPKIEHARESLYASINDFVQPEPIKIAPSDLDEMVHIPKGQFRMGVNTHEVPFHQFDWTTCMPARSIELEEFYIDRFPITNHQYDEFCKAMAKLSTRAKRKLEHPGQKHKKIHRRNTRGDHRFGPDHPVVGIDWFDAWAYARWVGKQLPTETQWEKAARGVSGSTYPWGDTFDQMCLRSAGSTYGYEPKNLLEWVVLLSKGTHEFPPTTTAPVDAHPNGSSCYGVQDMCGNAWEFTRTCFSTREDVRPAFTDFEPIELMGTREGHVVIRGGAWSSPASIIGAAYRGFDLLTDRHTEIGFRCIWEPENSEGE